MTAKELQRLLTQSGWTKVSQSGSHAKFKKPGALRPIIVPVHSGDLKHGMVQAILKQAGLKD